MSDVFAMRGWPDELLICQLFYEIHEWDDDRTQDHFLKIFYKLLWQVKTVYDAADRDATCRREVLSFIDKVIFGSSRGKCPFCS
ncbi:hypothetical protein ACFY1J_05450 [Streptomyces sp. NPDC001406]|uniref:hypothetical protein n=1 Tax=Streptomyces sp. NPDC001406 TaxID=3364572 RepID=UPI0036A1FB11